MLKTSALLFERVILFDKVFNSDLKEFGYAESQISIKRLENSGLEFPSNPVLESVWINLKCNIQFVFRTYENFFTDFEICDLTNQKTLSINSYKSHIGRNDLEIHLMEGDDLTRRYYNYLLKTLIFLKETVLNKVITGEQWIEIPFNWQDQK